MGVIDSVFLGHEFDIVGILVRAAQCVCVCVCWGCGLGGVELWVANTIMRLFSFLYVAASHITCTSFFLCIYIVSCHISITFLKLLKIT